MKKTVRKMREAQRQAAVMKRQLDNRIRACNAAEARSRAFDANRKLVTAILYDALSTRLGGEHSVNIHDVNVLAAEERLEVSVNGDVMTIRVRCEDDD